jgi:hypothetical protein
MAHFSDFLKYGLSEQDMEDIVKFVKAYPTTKGEVTKQNKRFTHAIDNIEKVIQQISAIERDFPQLVINADERYEHEVMGTHIVDSPNGFTVHGSHERHSIVKELNLIKSSLRNQTVDKLLKHEILDNKIVVSTHNLATGKYKVVKKLEEIWKSKGNEVTNHELSSFTVFVTYAFDQLNSDCGTKKSTIHDAKKDTGEKEKLGKLSQFEVIRKKYKK